MKRQILISCTVTLLASAIGACLHPAYAAEAAPQDAQASPAPAKPADKAADKKRRDEQKAVTDLSGVVVTPLRNSLESAQ